MPEYEVLAKKVKQIRKNIKMSQMEFSEKCDISHDTLSLIERCKIETKIDTIQKIAAYVGCEVIDLISDEIGYIKLYRKAMAVKECVLYTHTGYSFPVCPRCNSSLEREYQSYCDRCGQCLDWKEYRKAKMRYI